MPIRNISVNIRGYGYKCRYLDTFLGLVTFEQRTDDSSSGAHGSVEHVNILRSRVHLLCLTVSGDKCG